MNQVKTDGTTPSTPTKTRPLYRLERRESGKLNILADGLTLGQCYELMDKFGGLHIRFSYHGTGDTKPFQHRQVTALYRLEAKYQDKVLHISDDLTWAEAINLQVHVPNCWIKFSRHEIVIHTDQAVSQVEKAVQS